MRTYVCQCGGTLFFHSMECVLCRAVTAMCPGCRSVTSLQLGEQGVHQCDQCHAEMRLCDNRVQHAVCNAGVTQRDPAGLCRYCSLNGVIPDLSVDGNLEKWRRMERAKHRVLYEVDRLGLPIVTDPNDVRPKLSFEFPQAISKPVSTGHSNGLITIDIDEADSIQRETTRVEFDEKHRTLVGHFRHELGHYFWDVCVNPTRLDEFRHLFGDERNPSYQEAQANYYDNPPQGWQSAHISQYAAMHPWEDFAETFNAYLDMIAIVATATHFDRMRVQIDQSDFEQLVTTYMDVGVVANELNRDMGLLDLVPEVFSADVRKKLEFIHSLCCASNPR